MKIVGKENKYNGFYQLNRISLKLDNSEEIFEREQFKIPNSVGILVHNISQETIVLVKQFRVGPEKDLEEIVAGKLEDKDGNKALAAKREVLEETGYEVNSLEFLNEFYTCPGPVTEKMSLFYARVSQQVETGGGLVSENEEITIIERKISDFLSHEFTDAKTIIAQQWLKLKLQDA
ncbi:MAG: NUDIX hydrolase [Vicingaceae bacterium]